MIKIGQYTIYLVILCLVSLAILKDSLTGYPFHASIKIRYIDDLIIIFSYVVLLFLFAKNPKATKKYLFLWVVLFCYFILSYVLGSIYSIPLINTIYGFRDNYWYLFISMFMLTYAHDIASSQYLETKFNKLLVNYLYIQVAVLFIVQVVSFAKMNTLLFEDEVTGTLGKGQAHIFVYSLLMCAPFALQCKKYYLLFFVIIIMFFASARAAILISMLSVLLVIISYRSNTLKRFNITFSKSRMLFFVIMLVVGVALYNILATKAKIDLELLYQQQTSEIKEDKDVYVVGRVSFFMYSLTLLDETFNIWTGSGASTYAARSAKYVTSPLRDKVVGQIGRDSGAAEVFSGGSSLNVWFIEYGLIGGLLLFIFPYAFILYYLWKTGPAYYYSGLIFVMGSFANKLSEAYMTDIIFWLIVGIAILVNNQRTCLRSL